MIYILEYSEFNNLTTEEQEIKDKAISDGTFMKAPNGKKTNLTEKQWLQVRTNNFINWFGDWINAPDNSSKVIDDNGEPLVVYHTTNNNFDKFDKRRSRNGFFFTPTTSRLFAYNKKYIFNYFIDIKNPTNQSDVKIKELKKYNYDGIMDYGYGKKLNKLLYEIIAFEPNQIKSATNNNGDFSKNNNDIRF